MGVKKSTVCTSAVSGVSRYTPASSARSKPTSTLGSCCRANFPSTVSSAAGLSLEAQPAALTDSVRRNGLTSATSPIVAEAKKARCPILTSCLSTLEPALSEAEGVGFHSRVKRGISPAVEKPWVPHSRVNRGISPVGCPHLRCLLVELYGHHIGDRRLSRGFDILNL